MFNIGVHFNSKKEFIEYVEDMIAGWEKMMEVDGRRSEYENVIWGAHRILSLLDIEYDENNNII